LSQFLDKLPTILVLGVLVATFLSLRRHMPSVRMQLWGFAWGLIFVHFFVQVLETRTGRAEQLIEAVDLCALELSGLVFLVSLWPWVEKRKWRLAMTFTLGSLAVLHAFAASLNWQHPRAVSYVVELFFGAMLLFLVAATPNPRWKWLLGALVVAAAGWSLKAQLRGNYDPGVTAILALGFGLPGAFFWSRYRRFSPGVVCVAAGFVAWGAVFPVGMLTDHFLPALKLNPEIWNVPKFVVAFGMILTLVEDKSAVIEERRTRERADNDLLARFSQVTSHLLGRNDPVGFSKEIAHAITEIVSFRRAAIIVARENGSVFVAGTHGYSEEDERLLCEYTSQSGLDILSGMRTVGKPVCGTAFRFGWGEALFGESQNPECAKGSDWADGEDLIVPLTSRQHSELGWILLSQPTCPSCNLVPEISRLELFAADLGAQIENSRLQRQLLRSEKLAGIGQLVAGVAHELNNPLTGIIGYSDILQDEVKQETAHRRLTKLGEEARRMKRIVDSLLRFSRTTTEHAHVSDLAPALHDALQLREYFVRSRGIRINLELERALPSLAIGEDELKQILLNLLSNAIDAVEDCTERSIEIAAFQTDNRVVIRFDDRGPGFADLHRALDVFYTTKPIGKGTGLGLSICYGLLKACGGEIQLNNREPNGASVVLTIPIAASPVPEPLQTIVCVNALAHATRHTHPSKK
jgi:two-component system NtrC family sensor kinase